jgi:hypothetical protein
VLGIWQDSLVEVFAPRKLAIWAIFSCAVSIAGPFGTFDGMSWPLRLAYWSGLIGLSIPLHHAIRVLVERQWAGPGFWQSSIMMGLLFSALFSPIVWLVTQPLADRGMVTHVPLWIMALVTLLGSAVVRAVHGLWHHDELERRNSPVVVTAVEMPMLQPGLAEQPREVPRLLQRIDADKRGRIQHLSVRDHYVVVQTDLGQSTLLMRFADALNEVEGIDGIRVHRSHWVARTAVAGVERQGGKVHVRLRDGRKVPVSRSYLGQVERYAEA